MTQHVLKKNLLINWWHKESAVQSAAEKLCINNLTVDICSPLKDHFTVFHNAFSFTSFLTDVCHIFWFDMAAHVKKLNCLVTVEVYRKNIKAKKWKNSTTFNLR